MKRAFAVLLAAALLCAIAPLTAGAAEPVDITADFTDPLFLEAVYSRVLRKPASEPIYDTEVAQVMVVSVSGWGIRSLAGLEHFTGMTSLRCDDNRLTALPTLPGTLRYLYCDRNLLTGLPDLPAGLETLYCDYNKLDTLPALPASLNLLFCQNNGMTSLPTLPASLTELHCENNSLSALPALPSGLKHLVCANNELTGFDITGLSLNHLDCRNNSIVDEHDVTGFSGKWVEYESVAEPGTGYYYYPQNVTQQNTNCEHGHHLVWCIHATQFPFEGDGDPATYGSIRYQICKNKCGKVINHGGFVGSLSVLYRNNLTLPPPHGDMAGQNFRYEVTKGGEYIEVVQRNGGWEIRSKKHFLKNTDRSQISAVSDLGSFVVSDVNVYLRWFTWDWFKTYFLFGWIWF